VLRRLATAAGITGLAVLAGAAALSVGRSDVDTPARAALLSAPAERAPRLEAPAGTPAALAASALPAANGEVRPAEPVRALLAHLLRLWGVADDLSAASVAAWPVGPDGALDIAQVAARHHLAATFLADATVGELRAVNLPALIGLEEGGSRQPYLLRRLERDTAIVVSGTGESAWPSTVWSRRTRAAWVVANVITCHRPRRADDRPSSPLLRCACPLVLPGPAPAEAGWRLRTGCVASSALAGLPDDRLWAYDHAGPGRATTGPFLHQNESPFRRWLPDRAAAPADKASRFHPRRGRRHGASSLIILGGGGYRDGCVRATAGRKVRAALAALPIATPCRRRHGSCARPIPASGAPLARGLEAARAIC
jgi:hypothetical protein